MCGVCVWACSPLSTHMYIIDCIEMQPHMRPCERLDRITGFYKTHICIKAHAQVMYHRGTWAQSQTRVRTLCVCDHTAITNKICGDTFIVIVSDICYPQNATEKLASFTRSPLLTSACAILPLARYAWPRKRRRGGRGNRGERGASMRTREHRTLASPLAYEI